MYFLDTFILDNDTSLCDYYVCVDPEIYSNSIVSDSNSMYRSFVSICTVSDRVFVCRAPLLPCVHRSYKAHLLVTKCTRQKDVSRQAPQTDSDSDATLWQRCDS